MHVQTGPHVTLRPLSGSRQRSSRSSRPCVSGGARLRQYHHAGGEAERVGRDSTGPHAQAPAPAERKHLQRFGEVLRHRGKAGSDQQSRALHT